jgi:hypothetical protein
MNDNLAIWNALEKTDPAHTKGFKRAGGFSGTATKPIYSIKRMTEQFGPVGIGWGNTEPKFEVVAASGEIMVFCTAGLWHGSRENVFWGVGGDKVSAKRSSGDAFNSDEAFKASFTDALSNAMKLLGMSADIHMGRFDDHKYVRELEKEFSGGAKAETESKRTDEQYTEDAVAWMKKQTVAAEIHAAWSDELDRFMSLPAPLQGRLTAAKEEVLATITKSGKTDAAPSEWEVLGESLRAEIKAAIDTRMVQEVLNGRDLESLEKHSASAGKFIREIAAKRIGVIMQGRQAA